MSVKNIIDVQVRIRCYRCPTCVLTWATPRSYIEAYELQNDVEMMDFEVPEGWSEIRGEQLHRWHSWLSFAYICPECKDKEK